MTYGIPASAGFELQDLETVIAATRPTKSHDALRRALAARWPAIAWRVAAPRWSEFTMEGGIVDQSLARVADRASAWLRQRIAEEGGDYLSVWRCYKGDPSLCRTEFHGTTVWVFAPLGNGAADYVQIAVHELQEVTLGPLIDGGNWLEPISADHLCAKSNFASGDPKPIGGMRYQLGEAVHADSFLAELAVTKRQEQLAFLAGNVFHEGRLCADHPETITITSTCRVRRGTALPPGWRELEITDLDPDYLVRKAPLERFYADWSASSAGRLGNHLIDHWAMRFIDYCDGDGRQLRGIPRWLTRKALPKIEAKPNQTVFALMDKLQRFDERVGCAFGWYFFMLHDNRLSSAVGEQVAEAVEDGVITLPSWDRDVLRQWRRDPYSF